MSIITLDQINPYQTPYWKCLEKCYSEDSELRQLADEIHARRMLPPPTCHDCIEAAYRQLSPSQ